MKGLLLLGLIGLAAPVSAAPIWRDLDTSMTKADVIAKLGKDHHAQAYYGNGRAYYEDGPKREWQGEILFNGPGQTINGVNVWVGGYKAGDIVAALTAKYGEPVSIVPTVEHGIGMTFTRMVYAWEGSGLAITMERGMPDDNPDYFADVEYRIADKHADVGKLAGGL